MFTATITNKSFSEGVMQVVVSFSNGTDTFTRAFNITSEADLKGQVRRELARLNELSAFSKTLANGVYDALEVTPTPPTQAEIEKQEWFRDFNRLERVQKLIDLGALLGTETAVTTLRTRVRTNFKPAYIADM